MKSHSMTKMVYCRPKESQYTARQVTKFVIVPDRTRAMRMPSIKPDTTMDSAAARRWGGARSPTSGSMSCGVTVVMATMKDIAVKTARLLVMQRPSLG